MEFKRILNMSWFAVLSLLCICSSGYGNQDGSSHRMVRRDVTGSFPMDLMTASTSAMQKSSPKVKIDDDKKTLSQQVSDGKYGLIHKELFPKPSQRPGVLSYDANSEVPKDNVNNFGGLNKSDIWLAENHLLVLKGGVFPLLETLPEYSKPAWPPIDDFDAPRRQVKLPKHPKVPPPFPVQLTDNGPLQILGTNFTRTLNDSFFSPPYAIPPMEGYDPGSGPFFPPQYPYPPNATSGETPFPTPSFPPPNPGDGEPPQFPFPINGAVPPFFDSLPPGSAILPPPNITDQIDEDDLSIYYPPPYSFYYPKDNTTQVPPGPLVPGIVLPPPPDFFGVLGKASTTTIAPTRKTTKTPITTFKPKLPEFIDIPRKPQQNETVTVLRPVKTTKKPPSVYIYDNNVSKTTKKPPSVYVYDNNVSKTTKKPPSVYIYDNNVSNKPFAEYGPPPPRRGSKITITTTKVPLRAYYSSKAEQYPTRSSLQKHHRTKATTQQIYYYDDGALTNSISTPYPIVQPKQTKDYYTQGGKDSRKYTFQQNQPPQYFYLPQRPRIVQEAYSSPNNFKSHIVQLQEQLNAYQRVPKQYQYEVQPQEQQHEIPSSKPVYQYSFEVANYQEQHEKLQIPIQSTRQGKLRNLPKYSVQIEPALELTTTERPFYQNTPAPNYYQEAPAPPQKYYSNVPDYNYQEEQKYSSAVTPHPLNTYTAAVTPNPIYQAYYTKQEEQYFDDITKKYFTTFGKKLPTSTTPIPTIPAPERQIIYTPAQEPPRIRPPIKNNIVVNYAQPDYLYKQQPPQTYPQVTKQVPQEFAQFAQQVFPANNQDYRQNQNYRKKLPENNNVQTIRAISIPSQGNIGAGKGGSFISYELPGDDGAHFYFLTPQLTRKEDRSDITYYYTQASGSRI